MRFTGWFKSKPYWLKGGIVSIVLFTFSSLLFMFCLSIAPGEGAMIYFILPSVSVGTVFWEIVTANPDFFILEDIFYSIFSPHFIFGDSETGWIIATHVTSLIIFFLAGTFIGWIIGKIKTYL